MRQAAGKFRLKGLFMKKLDVFIKELTEIFGNRLKSVFIYGSTAKLADSELCDNVNLMVITDVLAGDDLKKVSAVTKKWCGGSLFDRSRNPEPVFMGEEEWANSADVYAMEYADIKENHRVVYGEDPVCYINVTGENLRLQCERETKNLLMRFRSHYLLFANDYRKLQTSIVPVIKSCNAIFKTVLRLKGIAIPSSPYEVLDKIHDLTPVDKDFYEKLLCRKEKHCKMNRKETYEIADKTVQELDKLLKYINNL